MSFGAATDFVPLLATIASPWALPAGEELEQPQPSKFPWVPVLLGAAGLGLVVWYSVRRKRRARRNVGRARPRCPSCGGVRIAVQRRGAWRRRTCKTCGRTWQVVQKERR